LSPCRITIISGVARTRTTGSIKEPPRLSVPVCSMLISNALNEVKKSF
jgi:hypothetical protein